jgi:poly-gamma-glutamate capsule biosynthesis protein CapA/YwtB (metallophosphatase superfamily)
MKLKALLFIVAIAGVAFFVHLLVVVQGCCVGASLARPEELDVEPEKSYLETKMLHFGDLMLGRGVRRSIESGVNPFEHVSSFIREGEFDAVVANLEGPFTHSEGCQIKPYSFRFDPSHAVLLTDAGITGVSLANNHSNDCYELGSQDTRRILSELGINSFGDDTHSLAQGSVWNSEETGVTFLGFDMTLGLQSVTTMSERIREASEAGGRVVVHIHWGNEYELTPHEHERDIAGLFAESGASLIIGHHPHVTQKAEIIGDTVVFYSLGNFIFDQDTLETQTGYAVEERVMHDVEENVFVERQFTLYPYRIVKHSPILLEGVEREKLCERILHGVERGYDTPCSFVLH